MNRVHVVFAREQAPFHRNVRIWIDGVEVEYLLRVHVGIDRPPLVCLEFYPDPSTYTEAWVDTPLDLKAIDLPPAPKDRGPSRRPGFYWVVRAKHPQEDPVVAEWRDGHWWQSGYEVEAMPGAYLPVSAQLKAPVFRPRP